MPNADSDTGQVEPDKAVHPKVRPDSTERFIRIPRPQIFTGPKHQTADQATVSYLREVVARIQRERYWGSGVTTLVSAILEDVAERVEATTRVGDDRC